MIRLFAELFGHYRRPFTLVAAQPRCVLRVLCVKIKQPSHPAFLTDTGCRARVSERKNDEEASPS
jgi:hypothetical protein